MFGFDVTNQDLALIGQYSENNFNGVNCGIMDQFAIAMGKKDHAIFLDTADLSYEYAPIHLEGAKIVIACSNKKRGLGASKYNERRSECETALAELQEVVGIKTLGDLNEEQFEQYKSCLLYTSCGDRNGSVKNAPDLRDAPGKWPPYLRGQTFVSEKWFSRQIFLTNQDKFF